MDKEEVLTGREVFSGGWYTLKVDQEGKTRVESTASAPEAGERGPEESDLYFCPGFTDIQVNGYLGCDYSGELTGEHIRRITAALADAGVTRHCPTIISSPENRILENLKTIRVARDEDPDLARAIPGIHMEGPYITGEDGARGAHDKRYVRDPDYEEYLRWQEASGGLIKIITLAPERDGAMEFIEKVSRDGVVAAIGHTAASPERIAEAVKAGATLSTHLGNGSHAVLPRLKNYLWPQLAEDRLRASIICDGFHLPEPVVQVFHRMKRSEGTILVSDVSPIGGLAPGEHRWGDTSVTVEPSGRLALTGTTYLAGSGHLLDRGLSTFMEFTGTSFPEAIRTVTVNPLKLLGREVQEQWIEEDEPDITVCKVTRGHSSEGAAAEIPGSAFEIIAVVRRGLIITT
jgi:N-acetylglucosamine-6-phosphate deacetylase